MSKKEKHRRFRDIWVNQTDLGEAFNMSAVAIGKKLKELGLRGANNLPTELAIKEDYCVFTPLKDGTPFYMWSKEKVAALLRNQGLVQLSDAEVEARATAQDLIELDREAEETGMDKLLYIFVDGIRHRDYPLIDRYLRELGSSLRLGTEPEVDAAPSSDSDDRSAESAAAENRARQDKQPS